MDKLLERRTWVEFKGAGLLWFVNRLLHLFGWALVMVYEEGEFIEAYPARCSFRGFAENIEITGFIKLTEYLEQNLQELLEEVRS